MDVNGDGKIDILSGSYSEGRPMKGLFQVFYGSDNGFQPPTPLQGTDGKPLVIALTGPKQMTDNICTRPTAVDIDGDGKLDIISGNFKGTFAMFKGLGEGKFEPKNSWLMSGGKPLYLRQAHSDPCFVDWDGDGDLDMLSGSAQGGAFLIENTGSKTAPAWAQPTVIVKPAGYSRGTQLGDAHISGPQSGTRVNVADLNGDGKLDLMIGDNATINTPGPGLDEAGVKAKLAEWTKKQRELMAKRQGLDKAQAAAWQKEYRAHYNARRKILKSERTGFVWVLYGK